LRKEDFRASFDQIRPDEAAKGRMLYNILNHSYEKKGYVMKPLGLNKAIPALALAVVLTGGLLTYSMLSGNNAVNLPPDYIGSQGDFIREDAVAPILNQFLIDDKHYILLSDDLRADFGLPASIGDSDIGEKLADIVSGPDKSLIGNEVFRYIPAGGDAVVAVKKDNGYQLFRFFTFESYNNNQDEDAARYLALYGIDSADDIAKIQFIGHSEQPKLQGTLDIRGEITGRDEIARFYSFYSVLKNSSDEYFDRLFNYRGSNNNDQGFEIDGAEPDVAAPDAAPDSAATPGSIGPIAPDQAGYAEDMPLEPGSGISDNANASISHKTSSAPGTGIVDMGSTGSGSTEPGRGITGDALANSVTIRIYNESGVYYDSEYYINISFISRFEVGDDFAAFMGDYIK